MTKPQRVLLLGGTSEIGLAICEQYLKRGCKKFVLAGRSQSSRAEAALARLRGQGADVTHVEFDAACPETHSESIDDCFDQGPVDIAIVAFGVLGDNELQWTNQQAAVDSAMVNHVGAISVGVLLADQLKHQGDGQIIALSSVAGVRVRRSNFVYGSSKAGMDAFYLNLGEALRGTGVKVLVVRPGAVQTEMITGRKTPPLTITAEQVGEATVRAADAGKQVVWTPAIFLPLMRLLQHLPQALWRRLPF